MRKFFLIIWIVLLFWFSTSYSCKVTSKINECNAALESFKNNNWFLSPWASVRSIENFICLQDVPEARIFQIILDENFREIDDEMDIYFTSLTNSKNLYFWKEATFSYFDWINHIWEKSNYFKTKYINSCSTIVEEVWKCTINDTYLLPSEQPSVSNSFALDYLEWSKWDCFKLVDVKIEIFNDVAFNILQLNKAQVSRDQKKLYDQEQRIKYNQIADLMMINLSYIERIWMKWPSKIKNAY